MSDFNQDLIERRANCRIWLHILLWLIVPLGWVFSSYKMRYWLPVYIWLAVMGCAFITLPSQARYSEVKASQYGQKYSFLTCVLGSALTTREILASRRKKSQLADS
jgi:hypothetical protein